MSSRDKHLRSRHVPSALAVRQTARALLLVGDSSITATGSDRASRYSVYAAAQCIVTALFIPTSKTLLRAFDCASSPAPPPRLPTAAPQNTMADPSLAEAFAPKTQCRISWERRLVSTLTPRPRMHAMCRHAPAQRALDPGRVRQPRKQQHRSPARGAPPCSSASPPPYRGAACWTATAPCTMYHVMYISCVVHTRNRNNAACR